MPCLALHYITLHYIAYITYLAGRGLVLEHEKGLNLEHEKGLKLEDEKDLEHKHKNLSAAGGFVSSEGLLLPARSALFLTYAHFLWQA